MEELAWIDEATVSYFFFLSLGLPIDWFPTVSTNFCHMPSFTGIGECKNDLHNQCDSRRIYGRPHSFCALLVWRSAAPMQTIAGLYCA